MSTTPPTDSPGPGESTERAWHEWMMVAVGLTGLLSILAIIVSSVALSTSSKNTTTVVAAPAATARPASATIAAPAPERVSISVKADAEHGRMGPDKQWHDAFAPADFTVHAGATVTIAVSNYDTGPHTFTAPSLGVNEILPPGSMSSPHLVTFTFTAPSKPGRYQWWCSVPCDPWAMAHDGYMRGFVTVTA